MVAPCIIGGVDGVHEVDSGDGGDSGDRGDGGDGGDRGDCVDGGNVDEDERPSILCVKVNLIVANIPSGGCGMCRCTMSNRVHSSCGTRPINCHGCPLPKYHFHSLPLGDIQLKG